MMDMNMYPNNFMSPPYTNGSIGGYPGYGYPPYYPNMYGMGQQPQMMANMYNINNMPIEATFSNGSTVTIPPQQPMGSGSNPVSNPSLGYIQGGATINQGGYDPTTRTFTPPAAQQGFNPYGVSYQMPSYAPPMQGQMVNGQMVYPNGFEPYDPSKRSNNVYYSSMMPYGNYNRALYNNFQNQANIALQEYIYNEEMVSSDPGIVINTLLKDKSHCATGYIMGYDYYGNPIYSNSQYACEVNKQRQEAYEKAKHDRQVFYTTLAKIRAVYNHEEFDEKAAMEYYDPDRNMKQAQPKAFSYYTATPEERKEYDEQMEQASVNAFVNRLDQAEAMLPYRIAQRNEMFAKIKESHDRLLGIEPGQPCSLQQFLDNGYKLCAANAAKEIKAKLKTGYDKYSTNNFRQALARETHSQIPIQSKDDEYVPIEAMLKNIYEKNRRENSALAGQAQIPGFSQPQSPGYSPTEMDAHNRFMIAMQNAKEKNDIRLMARGG